MKFAKIVTVDYCGLTGTSADKILAMSTQQAVIHTDDPTTKQEIIARIGDADCVLVSWRTKLDAEILQACPNISYIGMCCSLYDEESANVDIKTARSKAIVVKGVKDYGDEGTVEFIFAALIALFKGMGTSMHAPEPSELSSKTLGIVGLGFLGQLVAKAAQFFGMKVLYFSRTRKPELETPNLVYTDFTSLLEQSDVVSAHLPRNVCLFQHDAFARMKSNAVFVNTSLGQPFEAEALLTWLGKNTGNYALFDLPGSGQVTEQCELYPNCSVYKKPSGFTTEARIRLTDKVFANMCAFEG